MKVVKAAMEDVELEWNPKKCAVVHVRRGVHVNDDAGLDEAARIPSLEERNSTNSWWCSKGLCRRIN